MRGRVLALVVVVLLSGCLSPAPGATTRGGSDGSDQENAADPARNLTGGGPDGAVGGGAASAPAPNLYRLPSWSGQDEVLVFEGRAPISMCPERLQEDYTGLDATARFLCRMGRVGADAHVPPGTAALRLVVKDLEDAVPASCQELPTCGVLAALLVTNRGHQLVGERLEAPPYEWLFELDEEVRQAAWSLPDHSGSGYSMRLTSGVPTIPDRADAPEQGSTVPVELYALRDPAYRPFNVTDAYATDDDWTLAPGVRLFEEEAVTLTARAGVPRHPLIIRPETGGFIAMGTREVVVVTRWSDSPDCPDGGPCVPWLWVLNGQFMNEVTYPRAEARGDGWAVYRFPTSLHGALMWSELPDSGLNAVGLDPVHCIQNDLSPCLRPGQETYKASYELDAIVNVETWNTTADVAQVMTRYGLG